MKALHPKRFTPSCEQIYKSWCGHTYADHKYTKKRHNRQQRRFAKIDVECPPGYRRYGGYG